MSCERRTKRLDIFHRLLIVSFAIEGLLFFLHLFSISPKYVSLSRLNSAYLYLYWAGIALFCMGWLKVLTLKRTRGLSYNATLLIATFHPLFTVHYFINLLLFPVAIMISKRVYNLVKRLTL